MSEPVSAYPLKWPAGWKRTPAGERTRALFNRAERVQYQNSQNSFLRKSELTIANGVERVLAELEKFGVTRQEVVISSDLRTRQDGLPYSNAGNPTDPGVAVYWQGDNGQQCMAIDRYERVADNLAAVAATIEAMRAIERHGGATILSRAFMGFKQLAASTVTTLSTEQAADLICRHGGVAGHPLSVLADRSLAREAIRVAMNRTHPDNGGRSGDFALVGEAKRILTAHHGGQL